MIWAGLLTLQLLQADAYNTPSNGLLPEEQKAQGPIKPKLIPPTPKTLPPANSPINPPILNNSSSGNR